MDNKQKVNAGDKVKVNMEKASWGGINVNWEVENNIENINDSNISSSNDDHWVWS